MEIFMKSGMFGVPLLILTLVIAGLIIRAALSVGRKPADGTTFSILFWGFVAAVLGFLGQCSGIYNGLTAISHAREISPSVVAQGLAESFSTTLWGGGLLMLSGVAWFILKWTGSRLGSKLGSKPGPV